MGKRAFLSYAEEDSKFAVEIENLLEQQGFEVYFWQDPKQRGVQFIPKIESEIYKADVFVALMSPDYLISPFCTLERNFALRKMAVLQSKGVEFIIVVKVRNVEHLKAGFLGDFDWYDFTDINKEKEMENFMAKFGEVRSLEYVKNDNNKSWPTFQNRRDELDDLISNLANISGDRFFLLLAGPQMGKSWLVTQLPIELSEKESGWKILRIDLREQIPDVRSDSSKLLSVYFDFPLMQSNIDVARQIARLVSKSESSWLLLLDSAELLSNDAATELRKHLSEAINQLRKAGNIKIRLAFVAASRTQFSSWKGVIPAPRFHTIQLTHFDSGVIIAALREMSQLDKRKDLGQSWYQEMAEALEEATEGLPHLLMEYLQWIRDEGYLTKAREIRSRRLFKLIAVSYIENVLLSAESLLPFSIGSEHVEARKKVLKFILLELSAYRWLTESHLKKISDINDEINLGLKSCNWDLRDLWHALAETHIVESSPTIFYNIYPAIRKLLFRFQYASARDKIAVHEKANKEFFHNWWEDISGTDKGIFLVENFWHYIAVTRLLSGKKKKRTQEILEYAQSLFNEGIHTNLYTVGDTSGHIIRCLYDDPEIQMGLEKIEAGLFDKVLAIVRQAGQA